MPRQVLSRSIRLSDLKNLIKYYTEFRSNFTVTKADKYLSDAFATAKELSRQVYGVDDYWVSIYDLVEATHRLLQDPPIEKYQEVFKVLGIDVVETL